VRLPGKQNRGGTRSTAGNSDRRRNLRTIEGQTAEQKEAESTVGKRVRPHTVAASAAELYAVHSAVRGTVAAFCVVVPVAQAKARATCTQTKVRGRR
jgi:hypothetical protein